MYICVLNRTMYLHIFRQSYFSCSSLDLPWCDNLKKIKYKPQINMFSQQFVYCRNHCKQGVILTLLVLFPFFDDTKGSQEVRACVYGACACVHCMYMRACVLIGTDT